MALAVIQDPGEDILTQLCGMSVSPLSQCLLAFALDTFEQSIDRRAMHPHRTASPCFSCGHSLFHRPDKLSPGSLPCVGYLTLGGLRHDWHDHSSLPPRRAEPHANGFVRGFFAINAMIMLHPLCQTAPGHSHAMPQSRQMAPRSQYSHRDGSGPILLARLHSAGAVLR